MEEKLRSDDTLYTIGLQYSMVEGKTTLQECVFLSDFLSESKSACHII